MNGKKVAGLVGDLASTEAAYTLKTMIEGMGGNVECRTDGAKLPAGNRGGYVGTASIEDIDAAKYVMIIGANPAIEAPVLNARIRKAWTNGCDVDLIGQAVDLTYEYNHKGTDRAAVQTILDTKPGKKIVDNPSIVIVGQGALQEADGEAVLAAAMAMCEASGSKLMVLHSAAGRVGAMDVGAVTDGGMKAAIEGADVIYNMGADEFDIAAGPTVVYQGSHGDRGAHRADIILPAAAYTEENGVFVNTEGRPQLALRAGFAPGEAKENWAILRALSAELGQTLPFDSMAALRTQMIEATPHLAQIDDVPENEMTVIKPKKLGKAAFRNAVTDFYLSNPIARASELMAELSANAKARAGEKIAAE